MLCWDVFRVETGKSKPIRVYKEKVLKPSLLELVDFYIKRFYIDARYTCSSSLSLIDRFVCVVPELEPRGVFLFSFFSLLK